MIFFKRDRGEEKRKNIEMSGDERKKNYIYLFVLSVLHLQPSLTGNSPLLPSPQVPPNLPPFLILIVTTELFFLLTNHPRTFSESATWCTTFNNTLVTFNCTFCRLFGDYGMLLDL